MTVVAATVGDAERLRDLVLVRDFRRVLLVASEESKGTVARLSEFTAPAPPPEPDLVVVPDPGDVALCYEVIRPRALRFARGLDPGEEAYVSITGGTKPMAVALSLATAALGWRYIYLPDPAAKGSLSEGRVHVSDDPYTLFLRIEWDVITRLVDSAQYAPARDVVEDRARGAAGPLGVLLRALFDLLGALDRWDRFDHRKAADALAESADLLLSHRDVALFPGLARFAERCRALEGRARDCARVVAEKRPSRVLLADLIGNADRRQREGRRDDAVARLYRALEMAQQIAFFERFSTETGDVDPARLELPAAEHADLEKRKRPIQFGLDETLGHLERVGHPLAASVAPGGSRADLRKLLAARNNSILAHGVTPVDDRTYERFREVVERARVALGAPEPTVFPVIGAERASLAEGDPE